jgi:hypothetical protein
MAVPPTGIVLFLGIGCNASGVLLCISISLISWCRFEVVRSRSSREHVNNLEFRCMHRYLCAYCKSKCSSFRYLRSIVYNSFLIVSLYTGNDRIIVQM